MLNPEKRKESKMDRRLTPEEMKSFVEEIGKLHDAFPSMMASERWFPTVDRKGGEEIGQLRIYDRSGGLIFFEDAEAIKEYLEEKGKQIEKGLGLIQE